MNANHIDYEEWLISTDRFWRAYPLGIDTVIVANTTGGVTTVHKCSEADQERIEPPTPKPRSAPPAVWPSRPFTRLMTAPIAASMWPEGPDDT